jgi:hypothetical protein
VALRLVHTCVTNPMRRLVTLVRGLLLMVTCPSVFIIWGALPDTTDSSDVLPEPEGPMSASTSPGSTWPVMSWRIWASGRDLGYWSCTRCCQQGHGWQGIHMLQPAVDHTKCN